MRKLTLFLLLFTTPEFVRAAPKIDWASAIQVRPVLRIPLLAQITGHGTTLTWGASPSAVSCTAPCTFGYNVFRGTATGAESATPQNSAPLPALVYFDAVTLTSSPQTYFYVVQAVETVGGVTVSSGPSNEVSVTFPGIPAAPPTLVATPK